RFTESLGCIALCLCNVTVGFLIRRIFMNSRELLENIPYKLLSGELPEKIEHITMDSRDAVPGSLFVCIEGYTVDGHDFAEQATKCGATLILSEKPVEVEGSAVL